MESVNYYPIDREAVVENTDFRRVVYTAEHVQVVFMSVPSGEGIGEEVHESHDQTLVVVAGEGKIVVGGEKLPVHPGDAIVIPAGAYHDVRSLGPGDLKLVSLSTPPHHPPGTIHPTKASAAKHQEH